MGNKNLYNYENYIYTIFVNLDIRRFRMNDATRQDTLRAEDIERRIDNLSATHAMMMSSQEIFDVTSGLDSAAATQRAVDNYGPDSTALAEFGRNVLKRNSGGQNLGVADCANIDAAGSLMDAAAENLRLAVNEFGLGEKNKELLI